MSAEVTPIRPQGGPGARDFPAAQTALEQARALVDVIRTAALGDAERLDTRSIASTASVAIDLLDDVFGAIWPPEES